MGPIFFSIFEETYRGVVFLFSDDNGTVGRTTRTRPQTTTERNDVGGQPRLFGFARTIIISRH